MLEAQEEDLLAKQRAERARMARWREGGRGRSVARVGREWPNLQFPFRQ